MTDHLSPIEAIMWRVGQDATLRMTIGALMILDRPPSSAAMAERLAFATAHAPRMSQRPDSAALLAVRPAWVEDPDAAPEQHFRSLAVASPGSMRQVLDLVGLLEPMPFEPERSPWDITLVEGLEEGRAALYLRAHHVLTDGLGGIRLLGLLLDEPRWPRVGPAAPEPPSPGEPDATENGRRPGVMTMNVRVDLPNAAIRVLERANSARQVDPVNTVVRGVQRALDVADSVSRQLLVTGGPLSPCPATRSVISRFEVLSVEGARGALLSLGGSRNDLLVAAAAAGIGLYHERLGDPCPQLRVATPTSQRHSHGAGGNWFAPTRLEVPTAVVHPGPQFGVVAERLSQARREPALQVASQLVATIRCLPTRLLVPALRAQAESVDFAATILPGLRGSRRICGARIEGSYPLGPRLGCPMNITAFGNDDRLDLGIALDPTVVVEPDLLVECLREAFAGFVSTTVNGSGSGNGNHLLASAGAAASNAGNQGASAPPEPQ